MNEDKQNRNNLWIFIRDKFFYKEISKEIGWWFTLGSLCFFLLILQVITGIALSFFYEPTLEGAYRSVQHLQAETSWGWLLRGTHFWSANLMLIAVSIHMMRVFFHAGYKKPNEFTWVTGVALMLLTWTMALTGYILVWSDRSFWAATIIASCLDYVPLMGKWLLNILGGHRAGGITLSRYFTFHILLLPFFMALVSAWHLFLIQLHGEMGPPPRGIKGTRPFYPYQLTKDAVVALVVLVGIIGLAKFAGVPTDKPASVFAEIKSVPKPEWFILFGYEILKMFEGKWLVIAILVIPPGAILLWAFLPFYERNTERAYINRPLAVSLGISLILVMVYLSLIAHVSSPFPGRFFVPQRKLKLKELAGIALFEKNVCYSCHSVLGTGMKHAPDLWKAGFKYNLEDIKSILDDPDRVLGKGKMVKYYLDKRDKEALASYVKSMDFVRYDDKKIELRIFRAAYIVYRIKYAKGNPEGRIGEREIFNILNDNKDKLFPEKRVKEVYRAEIKRIAKYLSSLDYTDKHR